MRQCRECQGFTLSEVLVVVGVIVLVGVVLLPAMGGARTQSKMAVDQAHLYQIGMCLNGYAKDHANNYPRMKYSGWLFDMTYSTSDELLAYGGAKEIFYCPLEGVKNPNEDIFWRACECWQTGLRDLGDTPEPVNNRDNMFRVTCYFWLLGPAPGYEQNRPGPPKGFMGDPPRTWVTESTQSKAAETEFVTDVTVSMGADPETASFGDIRAGLWTWGVLDKTAHLNPQKRPVDGNILYVDGHVARKPFTQMQKRFLLYGISLPYNWW